MAGKQFEIYQNYVKRTTANNVEPTVIKGDDDVWAFFRENSVDFRKPDSYETRFWDGGRGARRFNLADGRVVEYATTNTAIGTALIAVFENATDYYKYRKPMGMFHYLYT